MGGHVGPEPPHLPVGNQSSEDLAAAGMRLALDVQQGQARRSLRAITSSSARGMGMFRYNWSAPLVMSPHSPTTFARIDMHGTEAASPWIQRWSHLVPAGTPYRFAFIVVGGVVADEMAKDARTAHVTLYHDAEHPSALEIPIMP